MISKPSCMAKILNKSKGDNSAPKTMSLIQAFLHCSRPEYQPLLIVRGQNEISHSLA